MYTLLVPFEIRHTYNSILVRARLKETMWTKNNNATTVGGDDDYDDDNGDDRQSRAGAERVRKSVLFVLSAVFIRESRLYVLEDNIQYLGFDSRTYIAVRNRMRKAFSDPTESAGALHCAVIVHLVLWKFRSRAFSKISFDSKLGSRSTQFIRVISAFYGIPILFHVSNTRARQ